MEAPESAEIYTPDVSSVSASSFLNAAFSFVPLSLVFLVRLSDFSGNSESAKLKTDTDITIFIASTSLRSSE